MYYSYKCTYCGRLFYTYNRDKYQAANTLYHTIKTHLHEYNEDHKEYQMDDGERTDTEQIYNEMRSYNHPPRGGYKATGGSYKAHESSTHSSTTSYISHSAIFIVVVLFLLILGVAALYFYVPEVQDFFMTFVIPQ